MTETVEVELGGKIYLVRGSVEFIGVAREIQLGDKTYRHAIEMRRDPPDMTIEDAAKAAKPLLDEWEQALLSGEIG